MTGTTNLNLTKPTVGADADAWGVELNADLDILDALLQTAITGLTLSTAGASGTFGVAPGAASGMILATAYTKTTSAWAAGTGTGALDTGSIANNSWYHVFLIQRVDTGIMDLLISISATSPTMPTSFTRKRRIGAMRTDGSAQWLKFTQNGDEFLWTIAIQDFAGSLTASATAQDLTLSVPPGVKVMARLRGAWGNGTANAALLIDAKDVAAVAANSPVGNATAYSPGAGVSTRFNIDVRTDAGANVKIVCTDNGPTAFIVTFGWIDTRGKG
jgi:hypothetical protein